MLSYILQQLLNIFRYILLWFTLFFILIDIPEFMTANNCFSPLLAALTTLLKSLLLLYVVILLLYILLKYGKFFNISEAMYLPTIVHIGYLYCYIIIDIEIILYSAFGRSQKVWFCDPTAQDCIGLAISAIYVSFNWVMRKVN
jgi:hypothetical protein